MTNELKQFIAEHENDDIYVLTLKSKTYKNVDVEFGLKQIIGRKKIKTKVPHFYSNFDIYYPNQLSLEQSSSQQTAEYKSTLCNGKSLVDLTGGFGIDCYFMSKNFKNVVYVERQIELCNLASHNFNVLNSNNITVINSNSVSYLSGMEKADWIYIDPARRSSTGKKVVLLSDCEPDVSQLSEIMLQKASRVMIKLSPMMDISAVLHDLKNIFEIHVISIDNECKEILLLLNDKNDNNTIVKTINIRKNNENQEFSFSINEEYNSQSILSTKIGKFLYEPNASILKSGAFKLIGKKFNLAKLHVNTHLYSSDIMIDEFPGRVFEIIKVWENSKKSLKSLEDHCQKANITTRNYPISVAELRKKLKIQDGGDIYLFACTSANNEKIIIECAKINT